LFEPSPEKTNEERFRQEFREQRQRLRALPLQVDIEITTRCNLRCFTCPKTYGSERGADLDRDLFDRIAAAVFPTARSVNLSGFGEPMLARDFPHFFDSAIAAGLEVGFITNGTRLTAEWIDRFAATPTHLFVSVDAASVETAAAMRPGLDWPRLRDLLKRWAAARSASPQSGARLLFNFVATRRNVHELPDVADLAAECGAARVEVLNFCTDGVGDAAKEERLSRDLVPTRQYFAEAAKRAATHGVSLLIPPGLAERDPRDAGRQSLERLLDACEAPLALNPPGAKYPVRCSAPWFRTYVNLRGDVRPCCWYPHAMGNLRERAFDAIWNGSAYRKMRRRINTRFPHLGCKECQLVWGIAAGSPESVFQSEKLADRFHTQLQRLRRRWARWRARL
jgi:radical SAM protein with 4Fe4S-binding SPASM domain